MYKVYTDVGGIKKLYHACPPVLKIIHSLKLVDFLHAQGDNPWYNYYLYPLLYEDVYVVRSSLTGLLDQVMGEYVPTCFVYSKSHYLNI